MKKVFMVHGFMGEPNGGWRPWLMGELAKEGVYACALPMPTPKTPKKDEWVEEVERAVRDPNEECFLVGHSLGVPTILRYLERLSADYKIGGAVLVSGPARSVNKEEYRILDHFYENSFDFEYIKNVCKNFVVIHGDNDHAVPFEYAEELSKNLNCKLISIPNGGHLGGSDGFRQLPQALAALKEMFK
jgi:predicted alpha/beta hydrolase family esterase